MRDQIWKNFQNSIFKTYILEEMIRIYQERERYTNIVLAFASSGSVAAWAVWELFPMLWAGIIAASNVVLVIKPYFPYSKYLKEIREKKQNALSINLEFEKLWYKIQYDKLTEDEAMEEFFLIRENLNKAYNFSEDISLQHADSVQQNATIKTKTYFEINYDVTINNNENE